MTSHTKQALLWDVETAVTLCSSPRDSAVFGKGSSMTNNNSNRKISSNSDANAHTTIDTNSAGAGVEVAGSAGGGAAKVGSSSSSSVGGGGGGRRTTAASISAATERLRHTKVGGAAVAASASAKRILLPGAAVRQRWQQTPAEVEAEAVAAATDAERCNRLRFNVNYNLCIICMHDGLDVREAFKVRMPGT